MYQDPPFISLVETLAEALDARDSYTAGHSLRVSEYACAIGRRLGLEECALRNLRLAARLHDIGKIGIPDAILLKPGPLTTPEFGLIKLHTQIGRRILEKAHGFGSLLDVVELHHENFDGSGYPYKLEGERIPLDARIVRVADAFDAMTTDRAYRGGLSLEAAISEIKTGAKRSFDPAIAQALLEAVEKECWNLAFNANAGSLMAGADEVLEKLLL